MASMVMDEDVRSKAEIYSGNELCRVKAFDLLDDLSLPHGVLPLEDLTEVGLVRDTGFFWLKQKKKTTHHFEMIDRNVSYGTEITGIAEKTESKAKMKKMTGVKSKEFMIWVVINEMSTDIPPSGKITFVGPGGISRAYPASAFGEAKPMEAAAEKN